MKFHPSEISCQRMPGRFGPMLLAATPRGLAGVWFEGQRHLPDAANWQERPDHPLLGQAAEQLQAYLAGRRHAFELPLDMSAGTAFQRSVWQALLTIPRGQTTSYALLGERIGRPGAARAVGAAVGRNPLSVVVPCHRVVGRDGALTGYAGGLSIKQALLALEHSS